MSRASSRNRSRRRSCGPKRALSAQIVTSKLREFLLVSYHEAPRYLADNEHIQSGYRVHFSYRLCLRSLFRMHNETLNIWTHLSGFILFVFLLIGMMITLSPYGFDYLHLASENASDESIQLHRGNIRRMVDALQNRAPSWHDISERLHHLASFMKENINAPQQIHQLRANIDHMRQVMTEMGKHITLGRIDQCRNALGKSIEKLFHDIPDLPSLPPFVESTKHNLLELAHFLKTLHLDVPEMPALLTDPLVFLPTWPLAVFLGAAMFCLFFSAVFHTFYCRSHDTCVMLQQLDIAGIFVLISGTTIPVMYYGFYCSEVLRTAYISTGVVVPSIAFLITMSKTMLSNKFAPLRAVVMFLVGAINAVPLVHMFLQLRGEKFGTLHSFLLWLALGCLMYTCGAFLYATRYPEKLWPGRFDIYFHSHTVFHVFVVLAALCHYVALLRVFEWRIMTPCQLAENAFALSLNELSSDYFTSA